ncbi:MAG TPA: hypothetical protein VJK03_03490 [Candidatus Nanoarchaeia archaeon]|nr:hypothetical protein [Candidatus Nanoarchaeia archaeon]
MGKSFSILVLVIILMCLTVEAKESLNDTIVIKINQDYTFDVNITRTFNVNSVYGYMNWTEYFGELNEVLISDEKGPVKINYVIDRNGHKAYSYDLNYQYMQGNHKVFIYSKENKMQKVNEDLWLITLPIESFGMNLIDDNKKLIVHDTGSELTFFSIGDVQPDFEIYQKREFNYKNFYGDLYILMVDLDFFDKYVLIQDGKKKFYLQNDSRILEQFNDVLYRQNPIFLYNKWNEGVGIISLGDANNLKNNTFDVWGLAYRNGLIVIDNELAGKSSDAELKSILIHELAHLSKFFVYPSTQYPEWLEEGIAVYSEVNYIDREFPNFGGHIPSSLALYNQKPEKELLEKWYTKGKSFSASDLNITFSPGELYSLYGFVINYYSKKYSEEKLRENLDKFYSGESSIIEQEGYISEEKINTLVVNSFGLSIDEISFPEKALLESNRQDFYEKMDNFTSKRVSAEKLNEFNKWDNSKEHISPYKTNISFIALVVILLVLLAFFLRKRKL